MKIQCIFPLHKVKSISLNNNLLNYYGTLRFQDCLRLVYGQVVTGCFRTDNFSNAEIGEISVLKQPVELNSSLQCLAKLKKAAWLSSLFRKGKKDQKTNIWLVLILTANLLQQYENIRFLSKKSSNPLILNHFYLPLIF